jgi:hypothetical protein
MTAANDAVIADLFFMWCANLSNKKKELTFDSPARVRAPHHTETLRDSAPRKWFVLLGFGPTSDDRCMAQKIAL